jgi:hypothetical protein
MQTDFTGTIVRVAINAASEVRKPVPNAEQSPFSYQHEWSVTA